MAATAARVICLCSLVWYYLPGHGLVYVSLALVKFISQVALIGSSPPRFLLLLLLPLYPSRPLDPIL